MRVITGSARGTKLEAPEGANTRPTSDMAKEAMFSILQFQLPQAAVLDLFAGSGQLGIEALSRGAKSCVFVDRSREAQTVILANLARTKLAPLARVVSIDAQSFLAGAKDLFDIALLDPPYEKGLIEQVLPMTAERMHENGLILCETGRDEQLPEIAGDFRKYKEYRYGKAKITTYTKFTKED